MDRPDQEHVYQDDEGIWTPGNAEFARRAAALRVTTLQREWLTLLIEKLPELDLTWPQETQDEWWHSFRRLYESVYAFEKFGRFNLD